MMRMMSEMVKVRKAIKGSRCARCVKEKAAEEVGAVSGGTVCRRWMLPRWKGTAWAVL